MRSERRPDALTGRERIICGGVPEDVLEVNPESSTAQEKPTDCIASTRREDCDLGQLFLGSFPEWEFNDRAFRRRDAQRAGMRFLIPAAAAVVSGW
jgi:hypothetical protein